MKGGSSTDRFLTRQRMTQRASCRERSASSNTSLLLPRSSTFTVRPRFWTPVIWGGSGDSHRANLGKVQEPHREQHVHGPAAVLDPRDLRRERGQSQGSSGDSTEASWGTADNGAVDVKRLAWTNVADKVKKKNTEGTEHSILAQTDIRR